MCKSRLFVAVLFLLLPFSMLHSQETQQDTLRELMRRIDILTEEIEKAKLGEVAERKYESHRGLGPAASQVYQLKKTGVSLAGYGEVTYQNFAKENDASLPSGKNDEIDYLRNIIYVGFRFSDRLVFNSEIEVEHGSTGKNGEVSMEFGYIEAQLGSAVAVRAAWCCRQSASSMNCMSRRRFTAACGRRSNRRSFLRPGAAMVSAWWGRCRQDWAIGFISLKD